MNNSQNGQWLVNWTLHTFDIAIWKSYIDANVLFSISLLHCETAQIKRAYQTNGRVLTALRTRNDLHRYDAGEPSVIFGSADLPAW